MPTLYDNKLSRNGYKIRLLASHLGLKLNRVEVDILTGASRTPEFLARNIAGRIPVLELEDGTMMPESNAILFYLAHGSAMLPADVKGQAETLRWMFYEQNMVECSIGTARFWKKLGRDQERPDAFAHRMENAVDSLATLDRHFATHQWAAVGRFTIADIALYGYISVADEAGITMDDFPKVVLWMRRLEALPAHITAVITGEAA